MADLLNVLFQIHFGHVHGQIPLKLCHCYFPSGFCDVMGRAYTLIILILISIFSLILLHYSFHNVIFVL